MNVHLQIKFLKNVEEVLKLKKKSNSLWNYG